jgi:hypothetical protein
MRPYQELSAEQVQSFMDQGYLVVKNCIDLDLADEWIDGGFQRLGYDRHDPATWQKDIVWMKHAKEIPVRQIAPRAWEAILDVVGGAERLETIVRLPPEGLYPVNSFNWNDAFIANFRRGADKPWSPPSPASEGWHKDGGYFRHFLDSPEQGLLSIILWTNMRHQGGGTYISPDSVRVVARYLAEHPEGIPYREWDVQPLISQCREFVELTGEAGDFVILHPYILHASSQNVLGVPRIISNPPIVLKEPMNFNRPDPADYSLLERATLKALGVDRLDFHPTMPREAEWVPVGTISPLQA